MQRAPVKIYQHANNRPHLKCLLLGLPIHPIKIVVAFPSFLVELITSITIYAPNIVLPGQILVHQKVFSTNSDANFRVEIFILIQLIDPVLKVVFELLNSI